jgi:hydrogenase/urease accessory protein HupE
MTKPGRTPTLPALALCTALALSSPAMAHDGVHDTTFLASLLHELAYTDYLFGALATVALGLGVAWRMARRKTSRTKL